MEVNCFNRDCLYYENKFTESGDYGCQQHPKNGITINENGECRGYWSRKLGHTREEVDDG